MLYIFFVIKFPWHFVCSIISLRVTHTHTQLSVRSKNTRERLGSFFKGFSKSIDESMLKSHKDVDSWFEAEKKFLDEYHVKYVTVRKVKLLEQTLSLDFHVTPM